MGAQNSQLASGRRHEVGQQYSRSINRTRSFFVTCHNCDYEIHQLKEVKFCYNCGAKQSRFSAYKEKNVKSENNFGKMLSDSKIDCNNRRSTSQVIDEDDIRENNENKKPVGRQKRKQKKSNKRCKSVEYVPFSQSQMYSSFYCKTPTEKIEQEKKQKKTHRRFSSQNLSNLNEQSFPKPNTSKRTPKGDPTMELDSKKKHRVTQGKKERRLSRQLSDPSGKQIGLKKPSKKEHRRFNSVILSGLDIKTCTDTMSADSKDQFTGNKSSKNTSSTTQHKRRYSQPIISSQIAHLSKGKNVNEYLYYEIKKPQNKKDFEVLQKKDPLRNVKAKHRRMRRNGVLIYNDGVLYSKDKNKHHKYFPHGNQNGQPESEVYSQRSSVCEPEDHNSYNDTCNDIKNVERLEPAGGFLYDSEESEEHSDKNKKIFYSDKNSMYKNSISLEDSVSCSRTPDSDRPSSLSVEKLTTQTPSNEEIFWSEKRRAEIQGSANRKRKRNKFFLQKRIKKYNKKKSTQNKNDYNNNNDMY